MDTLLVFFIHVELRIRIRIVKKGQVHFLVFSPNFIIFSSFFRGRFLEEVINILFFLFFNIVSMLFIFDTTLMFILSSML